MARSPTETIRFLTLEELARLFAAVRASPRDRALFLIAYRHGLRASEVGLLRTDDIDFRALRIMVASVHYRDTDIRHLGRSVNIGLPRLLPTSPFAIHRLNDGLYDQIRAPLARPWRCHITARLSERSFGAAQAIGITPLLQSRISVSR